MPREMEEGEERVSLNKYSLDNEVELREGQHPDPQHHGDYPMNGRRHHLVRS